MSQKIKNIRMHVGTQVGTHVFTAANVGDKGVLEMELTEIGILVHHLQGQYLVPFSNIQVAQFIVDTPKDTNGEK